MRLTLDNKVIGKGRVRLPASKSVALRAEILSEIFGRCIFLENKPVCDDFIDLQSALEKCRKAIKDAEFAEYVFRDGAAPLRFFLAYAASLEGFRGVIRCSDRLKKRPLAPLIDVLRRAGAVVECIEREGFPPLKVCGSRLSWNGGDPGYSISSQFASALTMASLLWEKPYELPEDLRIVSAPYVEMTIKLIDRFLSVSAREEECGKEIYSVENDWSAASYFYELLLSDPKREIVIENLTRPGLSVQGDAACAEIFGRFGVRSEFKANGSIKLTADHTLINRLAQSEVPVELNLCDTPDLVPAVTVGLCLAGIKFIIEGVGHLRHKESDRLSALTAELAKAGFLLQNNGKALAWKGQRRKVNSPYVFDSHGDHRIAMALAVMACKLEEIEIINAECVSKSFPDFFDELKKLI